MHPMIRAMGCIPTPKRLHDAHNARVDVSQKTKSIEQYYVQYRIQLVYIMIMILQGSTLGRFAKYYEILKYWQQVQIHWLV